MKNKEAIANPERLELFLNLETLKFVSMWLHFLRFAYIKTMARF